MRQRKTNLRLETGATVREQGRDRNVVVEFYPNQPDVLFVRAMGMRTRYGISIIDVYYMAAKRAAEVERRARAEARRQKRGAAR